MATVVSSWNEFDPLKHIIVGRAENACIPGWEPALEAKIDRNSDMWGLWGPRPLETAEKAAEELDYFSHVLESRGIRVDRPNPDSVESDGKYPGFFHQDTFRLHATPRCAAYCRP